SNHRYVVIVVRKALIFVCGLPRPNLMKFTNASAPRLDLVVQVLCYDLKTVIDIDGQMRFWAIDGGRVQSVGMRRISLPASENAIDVRMEQKYERVTKC